MTLPRGVRSAGVALVSAALVVLVFTVLADNPLIRGLETASLDLRFRLRGVRPPGSEVVVILVDDRSLESLGGFRNFLDAVKLRDLGFDYFGTGRGKGL